MPQFLLFGIIKEEKQTDRIDKMRHDRRKAEEALSKDISERTSLNEIEAAYHALYLGNLFTVEADLVLPEKGIYDTDISWSSSHEDLLDTKGKIRRPINGSGNRTVTLTAVIQKKGVSKKREFQVTILEEERVEGIFRVLDTELEMPVHSEFCHNEVINKDMLEAMLPEVVIIEKEDGSFGTSSVKWNLNDVTKNAPRIEFQGKLPSGDLMAKGVLTLNKTELNERYVSIEKNVEDFSLNQVKLMESPFMENRDRGEAYLLLRDPDQMLYSFRSVAGIDTGDSKPMEGWDAPECMLRGHTIGHYLSALSQAYLSSGQEAFKQRIEKLVMGLAECQEKMESEKIAQPGFLSAYPEEQFDLLEELTLYPKIWAPYYTLHKILAGLLDAYELAGNMTAMKISKKIGVWIYNRLHKLTKTHRNTMWALYIAGEFGGMNEVMARLYGMTKDERFLETAKYFDNDKLFLPMERNIDTLGNLHANQHIPQILGALRIYEETGMHRYYTIAKNFWQIVTEHHCYSIGGTGSGEMFKERDRIAAHLTKKTAETCASYNMLKLTKRLFMLSPDEKYVDYYERTLFNHILGSQEKTGPTGGTTYFTPLCPGEKKDFHEDVNTCCHGTSMENHTKYQEGIYFYAGNKNILYVNLYIPSELTWMGIKGAVVLKGDLLKEKKMLLLVHGMKDNIKIRLRIPAWTEGKMKLQSGGKDITWEKNLPGYADISIEQIIDDVLEIYLPMSYRYVRTPDDHNCVSLGYGPFVLAEISEDKNFRTLPREISKLSEKICFEEKSGFYVYDERLFLPVFRADEKPYHAYFRLQ